MAFRVSVGCCASWRRRDNCSKSFIGQADCHCSLLWRCKSFPVVGTISNCLQQHFWGEMVANAGAGPRPIPYREQTADKLAQQIKEALHPESRIRARQTALRLQQEQGCENAARSFHDSLPEKHSRCSILSERVAAWEINRTQGCGTRLSPLAAAVLLHRGLISVKEISM
jgi:hypothetical protein